MSDAQFFRDGIDDGRLLVRRCLSCERAAYPPMPGCPHCGNEEGEIIEASGSGTLYSWTVCHVAFDPAFSGDVPYIVGLVDLPEGARILARVDVDPVGLSPRAALRATFLTSDDGIRQLRFEAADLARSETT